MRFFTIIIILFGSICLSMSSVLGQDYEKLARKEAKRLQKEGYVVFAGDLPMERLLAKSYKMQEELNINGQPKYLIGHGEVVAGTKNQAEGLARENAQQEVGSLLEKTVMTQIRQNMANQASNEVEGSSMEKALTSTMSSSSYDLDDLGAGNVSFRAYKVMPDGKRISVTVWVVYEREVILNQLIQQIETVFPKEGDALNKLVK